MTTKDRERMLEAAMWLRKQAQRWLQEDIEDKEREYQEAHFMLAEWAIKELETEPK